jgi:hypothetical protein
VSKPKLLMQWYFVESALIATFLTCLLWFKAPAQVALAATGICLAMWSLVLFGKRYATKQPPGRPGRRRGTR